MVGKFAANGKMVQSPGKTFLSSIWTVLGPEFGCDAGQNAIVVRALYRLKSAGAAFRAHLVFFMRQMGYSSCKADPDLWLKAVI